MRQCRMDRDKLLVLEVHDLRTMFDMKTTRLLGVGWNSK